MNRNWIRKTFTTVWKRLLKMVGLGNRNAWRENFDPIYGLPYPALNDWLARNPKLREEYDAKLRARLATRAEPFRGQLNWAKTTAGLAAR
jgi:hypothetical protein